ncbi:hypothetical protein BCR39DRAFT_460802 [Naematelia encephala]|uniref:PHD-type domain-containing protein n=1 Tax=Naematelia encephala TaxID=71784 RepID=A0A1Y2BL77_9TREE|nr:hypothetical protein BCR39DRAFT_460802 [Naematelia encephala]
MHDSIALAASTSRQDADGDEMMKEAAEGLQSRRLRPSRAAHDNQKAGVSASGKGVKLGGVGKGGNTTAVRRKGKGADLVSPNQDFCSACRGIGRFLCCDGCPRSFHFMCLEPPLRIDELPEEETWYCKKCQAERPVPAPVLTPQSANASTLKPIVMIFEELVRKVDEENPEQFRLPQELRTFFAGGKSFGPFLNWDYVDADETRTRIDRKGFQEERDGTRLRDGKHRVVSCYVCGGSSIPLNSIAADPEASWRQIVSCDYCALHWHLDCLNPPLATMPNSGRKWMCPNHAEQVMPRRRTVREGLEIVDIDRPGLPNNGNIVIIPEDGAKPQLECEDMIINKRKYRVPERIIRLNFWAKVLEKR